MPVLSKRIVLDCFYLLIFYFEKFSTDVCRLPCAVNVNLNLSKRRKFRVRRDSRVILSNQKSVYNATYNHLVCLLKRATLLFQLFFIEFEKQVARFCCLFCRSFTHRPQNSLILD